MTDIRTWVLYHPVKLVFTLIPSLWIQYAVGSELEWNFHLPFVFSETSFEESFYDDNQDLIELVGCHCLKGRLVLLASGTSHGIFSLHQLRIHELLETILKRPILLGSNIQVDGMIFLKKNIELPTFLTLIDSFVSPIDDIVQNWLFSPLVPLFRQFP